MIKDGRVWQVMALGRRTRDWRIRVACVLGLNWSMVGVLSAQDGTVDPCLGGVGQGWVKDAATDRFIAQAIVYHDGRWVRTSEDGRFQLNAVKPGMPILVKASGYRQQQVLPGAGGRIEIRLRSLEVRGLYLTYYGVSSKAVREGVLDLIRKTDLNAVVIDVKGDLGYLTFPCEIPLARRIGADKKPTVKDMTAMVDRLHQEGIYVIGRIVVFKDNLLAQARPDLAVIDKRTGKPWIDKEKLAWVDPFKRQVWDYAIQIAVEAARVGFDEVQFDYVRFPTDGKTSAAQFSGENRQEGRVRAITQFLQTAYDALAPYNIYVAADLFGYTSLQDTDLGIGQDLVQVARHVDYLCLMVYPSGYHQGVPGIKNPVARPGEVVAYTLDKAKQRLGGRQMCLRPWLQNFDDYAFDKRPFTEVQIASQIRACSDARTSGWMLWDPSNQFRHTRTALDGLQQNP